MRKRDYILLLCLLQYISSYAQFKTDNTSSIHAEHFTTRQGLANNQVTAILQDRAGFMWFGTQAGLSRFDGYEFSSIKTDLKRPKQTFRNDAIWNLYEDSSGRLWATTLGDGLHQIDTQKRASTAYRPDSTSQFQYLNVFNCVTEESPTTLWAGTPTELLHYTIPKRQATIYKLPASMGNVSVLCLVFDSMKRLWAGTNAGLFIFDQKTKQFQPVPLPVSGKLAQPIISALALEDNGMLWVGTHGESLYKLGATAEGLFQLDTRLPTPRATGFSLGEHTNQSISSIRIVGNEVWLGSDQGLFRIQKPSNKVTHYRADRNQSDGLSSNNIFSLCPDREGNLWVGTDNGINKISTTSRQFTAIQLHPTILAVRDPLNNFSGVAEDNTGTIWLGSSISGLYRVAPGTTQPIAVASTLANPRVRTLFRDASGQLWVGTDEALYRLNPRTRQTTRYPCRLPVQYIDQETTGRLWIAGQKGPASFDPVSGQFTYLDTDLQNSMWYATALCVSRSGYVWIGHVGGGIHRYNLRSGNLYQYLPPTPSQRDSVKNALSDLNVIALYEDKQGRIWAGTQRGGLNILHPRTGKFRQLTTDQGLPSNYVLGITADHRGRIWVSTDQGLARYEDRTGTFRSYDDADGLPMIQFTENCVSTGRNRLFFGGPDGCLTFNPDSLRENRMIPPVFITGLTVNGNVDPLLTDRIELSHEQNMLAFRFAALSYRASRKNQYQYQLIGIDPNWIAAKQQRTVSYAGLLPGEYRFQVRGSNGDGVWNPVAASVTVLIHPPWWRSWWAYMGYALIGAALLYTLGQTYANRRALRLQAAEKAREAEQLRVIDELKTRFFTNITHEFRTPLTLIISPVEALLEELGQSVYAKRLTLIRQHARQLLGLANQLLDLSKVDARLMNVDLSRGDLSLFAAQTVQSFAETATQKDIQLSFTSHLSGDYWFDSDKLERILTNLVANALKFTPAGGQVTVELSSAEPKGIILRVSDTGQGIEADQQDRIFTRFYQVDNTPRRPKGEPLLSGIGIGLALVKELVDLQGGTITVDSRVAALHPQGRYTDGATTFTLILPYEQVPYEPSTDAPLEQHNVGMDAPVSDTTPNRQSEKAVVLVVEDNAELRSFIASLLPDSYRVAVAADGLAGLSYAREHLPDLIVTDIMMPGMDGITLCQTLKADTSTSHIPVMVLTAKTAMPSRLEGLESGADDYLTKPFEPQELRLRIRNRLDQQQRQRDQFRQHLTTPNTEPTPFDMLPLANDPFLQQLTHTLDTHLSDPNLSVDLLADRVNMSRRTLHRKLSAITGMGPNELIRTYRLRQAAERIRQGRGIAETAFETGFDSPTYFSKCFKDQFGMSPSAYEGKR